MLDPLVNTTRTHDIHVLTDKSLHILFCQSTTNLHQYTWTPSLFETLSGNLDSLTCEVIQHDNISTRLSGLIRLLQRLTLNLDLNRKPTRRLRRLDCPRNAPRRPNMVVLEH